MPTKLLVCPLRRHVESESILCDAVLVRRESDVPCLGFALNHEPEEILIMPGSGKLYRQVGVYCRGHVSRSIVYLVKNSVIDTAADLGKRDIAAACIHVLPKRQLLRSNVEVPHSIHKIVNREHIR